jgi:hypothetical protein
MAGMQRGAKSLPKANRPVLVWTLALVVAGPVRAAGEEGGASLVLNEPMLHGSTTRVRIELKAHGLFRPGLPPRGGSGETRMPKPLDLDIQTRLVFAERIVRGGPSEPPHSAGNGQVGPAGVGAPPGGDSVWAVRHVIDAASAINGEVRPTSASIRPEVSLVVAQRRVRGGPVVVVSPSGPLTWPELELVQGSADPLALAELLPAEPVAVGASWRVRDAAAQTLSGYDALSSNELDATLDSADAAKARIRLKGRIQGRALGGSGTVTCDGYFTFDRNAARIDHLDVNRIESRQPGPVEAGLDVKSTLIVSREPAQPTPPLSDQALAGVSLEITPERELLRMTAPGGKATLLHDRSWHTFWENSRLTVLKRLRDGQVIAQCNLMLGPPAGKGRHQDPNQFRDDIRRALKQRFAQFLGAGEVDGDPAGGFRYKVGVQGREGNLGIVWYYFLLAGPEGDQLLATFTLAEDHVKTFGDQDVAVIGSLKWLAAPPPLPGH